LAARIQPDSVAIIVSRRNSPKTSGYSRCPYIADEGDLIASKKALIGALALYLDFLNLFLMLLRLLGHRPK